MPNADSVKTKIQGLIDSANAVTGQTDADMTSVVASLIAGYGSSGGSEGGSGGVFYSGTYMAEERVLQNIEFSTPGGVTNFAMFLFDAPEVNTGAAFCAAVLGSKGGRLLGIGSNNSGATVTASVCYENGEIANGYYSGVKFGPDSVTVMLPTGVATERYIRAPHPNKTYVWAAW